MSEERLIDVVIGQLPLKVPLYRDERSTQALVARLNARLAAVEKRIGRIDSYASALLAAFYYASEADEAARDLEYERERTALEKETDDAELLRALAHISDALDGLLKSARQAVEPERPQ
jgi:hypothetical protein